MVWQRSAPGKQRRPDLASSEWFKQRRRILHRDHNTCQVPTPTGVCGAPARQVDHIVRGAGMDAANLRAICTRCHNQKSSREGTEEQRRIANMGIRDPEPHPFHTWHTGSAE